MESASPELVDPKKMIVISDTDLRASCMHEIERCHELVMLCKFDEAMSRLDTLQAKASWPAACSIEIHREAARALTARGYGSLAEDQLKAATQLCNSSGNDFDAMPLRVQLCFVQVIFSGQMDAEETLLQNAEEMLDKREHLVDFEEDKVEMLSFLYRIQLVKQTLCHRTRSDCRPKIAARLRKLIVEADEAGRYQSLWIMSLPFCRAENRNSARQCLQEIVNNNRVTSIIKGVVTEQVAELFLEYGDVENGGLWLDRAEEMYKACGHAFGPSNVRRIRAQYGIETEIVSTPLVDSLRLLQAQIDANFPYAVLQTAVLPLKLAFDMNQHRAYIAIQTVLRDVAQISGSRILRLMLETQVLATLNAGVGRFGSVNILGRALYEDCLRGKYWTLAYLNGKVVALSLHQQGRDDEAEALSKELYALCEQEHLETRSDASYLLGIARNSKKILNVEARVVEGQDIVRSLLDTIDDDIRSESLILACDKLHLIASIQFDMARISTANREELAYAANETLDRIRAILETVFIKEKVRILATCRELEITQLLWEGKKYSNREKELSAVNICTELIDLYQQEKLEFHTAMKFQLRGLCHVQSFQETKDMSRFTHLVAAEKDIRTAVSMLEKLGLYQQLLVARHSLTRCHVVAWELLPSIGPEYVLDSVREFESLVDKLRHELSILGNLQALLEKQSFNARSETRNLYLWAIHLSIADSRGQEIWLWSQKRKARSLSDMLGLGIIVPAYVKAAIYADVRARAVLEDLKAVGTALATAPLENRVFLQQRVEDIEEEGRQIAVLESFFKLRDGVVDISQLARLGHSDLILSSDRRVVFVDWIYHSETFYMVTVDAKASEKVFSLHKLSVSPGEVDRWIRCYFSTKAERIETLQHDEPLRDLDSLISPLQNASQPEDLLILSPTSSLASLPLHALRIFHETRQQMVPLLERNPIVYAPSVPVLVACLSRAFEVAHQNRPVFLANFDKKDEAACIYNHVNNLAKSMNGNSFYGAEVTIESVSELIEGASIVHFHGHCKFDADNVLQQALVLSEPGHSVSSDYHSSDAKHDAPVTMLQSDDESLHISNLSELAKDLETSKAEETLLLAIDESSAASHLTVERIFGLRIASALVVLIACDSASQTMSPGDEPLGLVAGLLCAGAAAVIGASWPIPSQIGRTFSEKFYSEMKATTGQVVDLSLAVREAALSIRDVPGTSAPYYWAPFTLNGSWIHSKMCEERG